jgi:hypothetical protein
MSARTRSLLAGLDRGGWRPTAIFAAVLAVLVIGTQLVNASIPAPGQPTPNGPNGPIGPVGQRLAITPRVTIVPATGYVVAQQLSGALPGVRLQRGAIAFDVRTGTSQEGPAKFLDAYIAQVLDPDSSSLTITSANPGTVGGRYPAVIATYTGVFTGIGSPVEGQLTGIVFTDGLSIVFDAWATEGGLAPSLPEILQMIDSLEVTA